jgi:general secretion pathway protein A
MAMFEEFYSFVRPPFGRDLQVSELFLTESHKEMLARMQYAAERRQFALCTGEVGAGKSTMARLLVPPLPDPTQPTKHRVTKTKDKPLIINLENILVVPLTVTKPDCVFNKTHFGRT